MYIQTYTKNTAVYNRHFYNKLTLNTAPFLFSSHLVQKIKTFSRFCLFVVCYSEGGG